MKTTLTIGSHDFYLLRNPLCSIDELLAFNDTVNAGDRAAFEERLRSRFADPLFQEAIYVASPELYREFEKWLNQETAAGKDSEQLLLTLYKYYHRMGSRCTPYGLFAGCSVGTLTDEPTAVRFDESARYRKHSRLDMNYVAELAEAICQDPGVKAQLRYFPNTSLYRLGDKLRYVEFRLKNKQRSYFLSSLVRTDYLDTILTAAQQGAYRRDLAQSLVSATITLDEALNFVDDVIASQVLVSELEPTVTGREFYEVLLERLGQFDNCESVTQKLLEIKTLLQDQRDDPHKYISLNKLINSSFTHTNAKDLIQTDLFFQTTRNQINESVTNVLTRDFDKLFVLSSRNANPTLESFKKRFYERYEEQEIPLLLVLDAETGIGYGEVSGSRADHLPLIDDLIFPTNAKKATAAWEKADRFKFEAFKKTIACGRQSLELTDADLAALATTTGEVRIPDSFFLFGSLLANSPEALDQGQFQFSLMSCNGPSAVNLLGRFCHGSESLTRQVKECIAYEEQHNPDAIYAEVVHLPEARIGNILMRPTLRQYEIPYLGTASVEAENVIPLDDLMVSVPYGSRIVLRSKKHNKEVIPRLTSAHNFHRGLAIYKFLCDLQAYGLNSSVFWDWGLLSDQSFLPRVTYKHVILSKAQWRFSLDEMPELADKKTDFFARFQTLRQERQMPRYVTLVEADNELLIDLESQYACQILRDKLRKRRKALLAEFLGTPENCFVSDAAGRYTNELIIPYRKFHTASSRTATKPPQPIPVRRVFAPGSEWLYLKLYAGTKTAERLLTSAIKPLTEQLLTAGVINKWFFIRYRDTDEHLRLRLHSGTDERFYKKAMEAAYDVLQPYLQDGLIYKLQTDTYQREIERYGVGTIALTEDLFFNDSVAIVNVLDMLEGDAGESYRWRLALRGIHMLLEDCQYALPDKHRLITQMRDNFYREFGGGTPLMVQLNDKYRAHSKEIQRFMNPEHDEENGITEAIDMFQVRSVQNQRVVRDIFAVQHSHADALRPDDLMPSYIHMFVNRMFISNQRAHELVIYHYLSKYYESMIARSKAKPVRQVALAQAELIVNS
ncbi:lantibiotic dehydratase [Spirosoma oryzicola]|uniref:lantibiotic dehydratase n=1 Tax=Spirosoma oryzicola TaxID=2898794 RepID=UPI001E313020|nr:lantibiotic dehydratase [Spirosoma oryzicola]UHG94929.1 lantibiotic dehydratase [Spirosoma oryzicola]